MNLRVFLVGLIVCFVASANAATLNVVGGKLLGATGVDVGGALYDVEFVDGSCIALFDGCNELSNFSFITFDDALAASNALLEQVFVGSFDLDPTLIAGCDVTPLDPNCHAITNFSFIGQRVVGRSASNTPGEDSDYTHYSELDISDDDLSSKLSFTFARWSPVPEPSTASLLALGLVGIAAMRRRKSPTI
jgi:hypothetical protein